LQALDLYAQIEQYLDFEEEIEELYKAIGTIAISKEPKTLIDIGCGQGEFCYILEHNGIKTFGVDLSSKQIEVAKQKGIDAKCIDIKDIDNIYDCATATFDVINYIDNKNIQSFIKNVSKLIKTDGYFIFDINSLFGFEEIAQGTLSIDKDDRFISIDADFQNNTLFTNITLFTKENKFYKKQNGTIKQYYYTNDELKKILQEHSFKVEEIIDFNLHSDSDPDKYIYVCKKV